MAAAVTERVWRASSPATIERDLSDLWRDLAAKGPIARAIMANLVIVRAARLERRAGVAIDAVASQHPSRVIIIDHDSSGGPCEIRNTRVGVVTFAASGTSRYGIEQIAVRSTCTDESLPSLIRRLARGALPISVWWAEDLSQVPPRASIVETGRQLVYDSRQWSDVRKGVIALEPWGHLDLADVNWRRLAAVRRAVILAAAVDNGQWHPAGMRITHRAADRALAWLLAGWLASRLNWPGGALPAMEELPPEGDTVVALSVGRGADAISVRSDGRHVVVEHYSRPRSVIGIPHEDDADAIAAELHSLFHDARLHDALSALRRYFSAK